MTWTAMWLSREEAQTALARIRKGSTVHREAVRLEVSSKTLVKALVQLVGTDDLAALMGRTQPPATVAARPRRARPQRVAISGEQLQAVLDRIHGGSTVKTEARSLGIHYNTLRRALQEWMGLAGYETLMNEGRARRAKLPPSFAGPAFTHPVGVSVPPSVAGAQGGDNPV